MLELVSGVVTVLNLAFVGAMGVRLLRRRRRLDGAAGRSAV